MTTSRLQYLLLFLGIITLGFYSRADGPACFFIREDREDVERIELHPNMTLEDVLYSGDRMINVETDKLFVILDGTQTRFSKFSPATARQIVVAPGSLIIVGPLFPDRVAAIRKNPYADAAFKSKPRQATP